MSSIYEISVQMRNVYEELANGEGVDLETGEILPEMQQALALTQNNLQAKAIDYGYVIKSFEDEIGIYDAEIKRLTARKKQMQNIQERLKQALSNAMQEFNIVEITGKTIRLSFRKSEQVEVQNIDLLDQKYIKVKTTVEPDKIAIKDALKRGEDVQGAALVTKQNIQIK